MRLQLQPVLLLAVASVDAFCPSSSTTTTTRLSSALFYNNRPWTRRNEQDYYRADTYLSDNGRGDPYRSYPADRDIDIPRDTFDTYPDARAAYPERPPYANNRRPIMDDAYPAAPYDDYDDYEPEILGGAPYPTLEELPPDLREAAYNTMNDPGTRNRRTSNNFDDYYDNVNGRNSRQSYNYRTNNYDYDNGPARASGPRNAPQTQKNFNYGAPRRRRRRRVSFNNNNNDDNTNNIRNRKQVPRMRDNPSLRDQWKLAGIWDRTPRQLYRDTRNAVDDIVTRSSTLLGDMIDGVFAGGNGDLRRIMSNDWRPTLQPNLRPILEDTVRYLNRDPAVRNVLGDDIQLLDEPFFSQALSSNSIQGQTQQARVDLQMTASGTRGTGLVEIYATDGMGIDTLVVLFKEDVGGEPQRLLVDVSEQSIMRYSTTAHNDPQRMIQPSREPSVVEAEILDKNNRAGRGHNRTQF